MWFLLNLALRPFFFWIMFDLLEYVEYLQLRIFLLNFLSFFATPSILVVHFVCIE